jgi:hypothetical protein
MKYKKFKTLAVAFACAISFTACKQHENTVNIPQAEGSGKTLNVAPKPAPSSFASDTATSTPETSTTQTTDTL